MSGPLQPQALGSNLQALDARLLQLLQNVVELQFNPFQQVLVVTGKEYRDLQDSGRAWLAEHLSAYLKKDVLWVQDGTKSYDRYFVGPPEDFIVGDRMLMNIDGRAIMITRPETQSVLDQIQGISSGKVAVKEKISRPPNAYILYRKDHHKLIKEANPEYTNNQISKVLGAAWKVEKAEVKQRYHRMADDVKSELMRAHPEYRYAPRKPGERRRRNRRNANLPHDQEAMAQPINLATMAAPKMD